MSIEAMKLALEAFKKTHYALIEAGLLDQVRLDENFTAAEALREAIEQAQKEKTSWTLEDVKKSWKSGYQAGIEQAQKQEPVAHRDGFWCADLTCKKCYSADFRFKHKNSVVNEYLTTPPQRQPDHTEDNLEMVEKQEPVAWMHTSATGDVYFRKKAQDKVFSPQPVYTSPPQRQWVGLTDEEANKIYKDGSTFGEMQRMVEAKLKGEA